MKKLAILTLVALAATQALAVVELKLGHFSAEGAPNGVAAQQFKTNVEKRTNGEVKINVFANNALGSPPEVLEQVILGAVDMSLSGQDLSLIHIEMCIRDRYWCMVFFLLVDWVCIEETSF